MPGDTLVLREEGEVGTLFVILTGRVTLSIHCREGKEVNLSVLSDGEFLGRSRYWAANRDPPP